MRKREELEVQLGEEKNTPCCRMVRDDLLKSAVQNHKDAEKSQNQNPGEPREREKVQAYSPEAVPAHSLERVPAHSLERVPAHSLERVPAHSLERVPAHSLERVPAHSLEGVPAHSLERVPAHSLEGVPAHSLERVPTHSLERVPAHSLERVPAHSLERVPAHSLERVPAHSLERVPTHSLERVPAHSLERVPAHSLEGVPAHSLERVPAHSLERVPAHSLERVPTHSPEAVPAHSLERVPAHSLERVPAHSLERVPAHSLEKVPAHSLEKVPAKGPEPTETELDLLHWNKLYLEDDENTWHQPLSGPDAVSLPTHLRPFSSAAEYRLVKHTFLQLQHSGYYWGSMTMEEAHGLLAHTPMGTFLIRDSGQTDVFFTLSYKSSDGPTSVRVQLNNLNFNLNGSHKTFPSLFALLTYYSSSSCKLTAPLRKQRPERLKTLCRRALTRTYGAEALMN